MVGLIPDLQKDSWIQFHVVEAGPRTVHSQLRVALD